jgi:hypothetical protein
METSAMARKERYETVRWAVIVCAFLIMTLFGVCLLAIYPSPMPLRYQIISIIAVQVGAAFFFPLTVGTLVRKLEDKDVGHTLWRFHLESKKAALTDIYANRDMGAKDLEDSFRNHSSRDILMSGPSLRLFLAHGFSFFDVIRDNIQRYEDHQIRIKAVQSDPIENPSIPMRAFVEEFNPDGTHPSGHRRQTFDWKGPCGFKDFAKTFCDTYARKPPSDNACRMIADLELTKIGALHLNGMTTNPCICLRRTICPPYCTAVIFPDKCYYTPNMLYADAPVNMPLFVFHRGGAPYERIMWHFQFLWWSGIVIGVGEPMSGAKVD